MKGKTSPEDFKFNLSLPPADLKIVRRNGVYKIFDPLRKNYFVLTEEEFVRQVFVAWMIKELGYPPSLMANEIGIRLNDTYKRCDTVVFSSSGSPKMIVEYKSPSVKITQTVFDQIARYNMVLNATFLVVSNGLNHYCCLFEHDSKSYVFLPSIPSYTQLKEFEI